LNSILSVLLPIATRLLGRNGVGSFVRHGLPLWALFVTFAGGFGQGFAEAASAYAPQLGALAGTWALGVLLSKLSDRLGVAQGGPPQA